MEELITLQITAFDATLFRKFQQHYTFVKLMESLGVFDVTTGSVTVHFGAKGEISKVEVNKSYTQDN